MASTVTWDVTLAPRPDHEAPARWLTTVTVPCAAHTGSPGGGDADPGDTAALTQRNDLGDRNAHSSDTGSRKFS